MIIFKANQDISLTRPTEAVKDMYPFIEFLPQPCWLKQKKEVRKYVSTFHIFYRCIRQRRMELLATLLANSETEMQCSSSRCPPAFAPSICECRLHLCNHCELVIVSPTTHFKKSTSWNAHMNTQKNHIPKRQSFYAAK